MSDALSREYKRAALGPSVKSMHLRSKDLPALLRPTHHEMFAHVDAQVLKTLWFETRNSLRRTIGSLIDPEWAPLLLGHPNHRPSPPHAPDHTSCSKAKPKNRPVDSGARVTRPAVTVGNL